MALDRKSVDPQTRRTVLWVVLYIGSLLGGLALAGLFIPSQAGIAPFMRFMFGLVLVLTVILLGLTAWQLSKSVAASRASWRWAVLLAGIVAGVAVGWWTATSLQAGVPVLEGLGTLLVGTLGLTAAIAVTMHSFVKIMASANAAPLGSTPRSNH